MAGQISPLLLRADGGVRLGTGHVMRCLALAQAWQESGGRAVFVMAGASSNLEARLAREGFPTERLHTEPGSGDDAEQTAELASRTGAEWLVVDGYHFSGKYQKQIKDAGFCLLVIDDHGSADHYWADLVLNQNLCAKVDLYRSRELPTRLLLDTRYVLLRREFWKWRGWKRTIPERARKVLVTLGGSDPDNVTLKVIHALGQVRVKEMEALVLVGASNPHLAELEMAARTSPVGIRVRSQVTDMPELVSWADVAIGAAGTSTWERAFLGLPSLVIVLADNQCLVAQTCADVGLCHNLGWHYDLSAGILAQALEPLLAKASLRTAMAERGPRLVDGRGGLRVREELLGHAIRLRRAQQEDCRRVWEWANEPAVRAASFSSTPIPWEHHLEWFGAKLQDKNCAFFIGLDATDHPLGQVRCELNGTEAVISVCLGPQARGRGYGPILIRKASWEVLDSGSALSVHAYIRADNNVSIRAFLKAGFLPLQGTSVSGHPAEHLVLRPLHP